MDYDGIYTAMQYLQKETFYFQILVVFLSYIYYMASNNYFKVIQASILHISVFIKF